MSAISDWKERLREVLFRRRRSEELEEELRFHVDRDAEERVRRGEEPAEARRQATLALGGIDQTRERVWDARGVRPLQDLFADVRYCLRALRRSPGFTATTILVLGLGIGVSTAVFSVVDAVVFSELPYRDASRLVRIYMNWNLSTVDYEAIRDQQRSLDAFGTSRRTYATLTGAGSPERIETGEATAGFFRALGVVAERGRLLEPGDERLDAEPVVVVSAGFAEQNLGGAERALGRTIALDGVSHSVIGVLPPDWMDLGSVRGSPVWAALRMRPPTRRGPFWLRGIGRLRPGVSLEDARKDLGQISERIFPLWASSYQDRTARFTAMPLREAVVGKAATREMGLFAGAVGLVLLIAVANVATLMLVRVSAREQELAVRTALGASRLRLVRLVLTEGLLVTSAASLLGIAVAVFGLRLIRSLAPDLPRLSEVGLDGKAAGFAVLVAIGCGVLVALAPVSRMLARPASTVASSDARRAGGGRSRNRVQGAFVVAEFALALPLLLGAALLLNSFLRLERVRPGFDPAGVVTVPISLPEKRYPDSPSLQRFWRQVVQRIEAAPGVVAAGLSSDLPPDNYGDVNNFDLVDHPVPDGASQPLSPWPSVSPEYFRALGVPLLDGRLLSEKDAETAAPVVVVSRAWAGRYLPGERAVGRQLRSGGCTDCPLTTIVGVVGDVKYSGLAGSAEAVYEPIAQGAPRSLNLIVRSSAPTQAALASLRASLAALDPELPFEAEPLASRVRNSLADPLRLTGVVGGFAAAAVVLAALGIFGLMSYVVRQRRREIAVRIALGAEPAAVTWMIVARGMRYALLGGALGLVGIAAEVRWLRAVLFEIAPTDPSSIATAGALLLGVAVLASWIPGRRAARTPALAAIAAD